MIYKEICDKGSIWNTSNCECECDKSCNVGEYLEYKSFKYRKKVVEKCTKSLEEIKLAKKTPAEHKNVCKPSCTIYVVLFQ